MEPSKEVLYGGAAGGGKSDALLMGGLQFVDIPGYSAIIFRRTYADLTLPGALIDRSLEWLGGSGARWNSQSHRWIFPSGAVLAFGNLERSQDKFRYQSAEFQYVGFDELTQFEEDQYRYLFSRIRRLEGVNIPLRMRSASNPGNIGHDWVKRRFMTEGTVHGRVFIPATLDENKNLDRAQYIKSLDELDPITRRQYLRGDWSARHGGSIFKREYFKDNILEKCPSGVKRFVRYWDKASTTPKKGTDPDWTVGLKLGEHLGHYFVCDVVRFRGTPKQNHDRIRATAQIDGFNIPVRMEQEPGSSGVDAIDYYARVVLKGYNFRGVKTTGSKAERAAPVATACEQKNVFLVNGSYVSCFLDELEGFPMGAHDDQVDVLSGAFHQLRVTQAVKPGFLLR
jgi:predicted phage terminase large subunit-like protein